MRRKIISIRAIINSIIKSEVFMLITNRQEKEDDEGIPFDLFRQRFVSCPVRELSMKSSMDALTMRC